jgi:uncharacterized membrane protein
MARVEASVEIRAPLADVWALYFDPQRWAAWVDGFASVTSAEGYPEAGGELLWRSSAAGRGQVRETVLSHQPRSLHRIRYEDPESAGELETRFEMLPGADRTTRVSQRLSYGLLGGGPLAAVTDFLFIRSQMRRSLERSLNDLRLEAGDGG